MIWQPYPQREAPAGGAAHTQGRARGSGPLAQPGQAVPAGGTAPAAQALQVVRNPAAAGGCVRRRAVLARVAAALQRGAGGAGGPHPSSLISTSLGLTRIRQRVAPLCRTTLVTPSRTAQPNSSCWSRGIGLSPDRADPP